MDFSGRHILVIGAGISGLSAVNLLNSESAEVVLFDSNDKLSTDELLTKLNGFKGRIVTGSIPSDVLNKTELAIISPGVPLETKAIERLIDKGIPIWGEIELAYAFKKGKIAAITGTNGKTTTTTLAGDIMKTYFEHVIVAGNIGIPYTQMVKDTSESSVTVIELSSFQLETIDKFMPDVSIILNITPDHLDRHHTMENYIAAKSNIFMNQTNANTCILNYEDSYLRELSKDIKARIIWFSSRQKLYKGLYLFDDNIIYNNGNNEEIICNIHELNIFGKHSYENAMAAIAAGIVFNIPLELIHKALINFAAVEHRIEYVAIKNGVKYYNDSKGTNPDASIQAVKAMNTKTFLIGGGYDKGSDYENLIMAFDNKIRYLVLIGQTREKIAETAYRLGFKEIVLADTLEEAVSFCAKNAYPGESVLLSPACASWGMFKNYEERGRMFKEYVHRLP